MALETSSQISFSAANADSEPVSPPLSEASTQVDQKILLTDLPLEILIRICSHLSGDQEVWSSQGQNAGAGPVSLVNRTLRCAAVPIAFENVMLFNHYDTDLMSFERKLHRLLALPTVLGAIRNLRIHLNTFPPFEANILANRLDQSYGGLDLRDKIISIAEQLCSLLTAISTRIQSMYITFTSSHTITASFYGVLNNMDIGFPSLRELQLDTLGPIDFIRRSPCLKSFQYNLSVFPLGSGQTHERCIRVFAMLKQKARFEHLSLIGLLSCCIVNELGASELGVSSLKCDYGGPDNPHNVFHIPLSCWLDAWSRLPNLQHLVLPRALSLSINGFQPPGVPEAEAEAERTPEERVFRRRLYGEILRAICHTANQAFHFIPTLRTINRGKDTFNNGEPYTREWLKGFATNFEREHRLDEVTEPWKVWVPDVECDGTTSDCHWGSCLAKDCPSIDETLGKGYTIEQRLFWWM